MSGKIVVPKEMWIAGFNATVTIVDRGEATTKCLEAALRWLSENPIVPTTGDVLGLLQERVLSGHLSEEEYCGIPATTIKCVMRDWQRRMFLAPEPEVPEAVKDIIEVWIDPMNPGPATEINRKIIEAYRRGKEAGSK